VLGLGWFHSWGYFLDLTVWMALRISSKIAAFQVSRMVKDRLMCSSSLLTMFNSP
jgi:hypothetical protein